ncbi:MAG: TPM domain-containing protein [Thermosediminibacteraceae bacterium]|nr:TPM domain-containing protein [Thermosediminibacteraceae bacterium]
MNVKQFFLVSFLGIAVTLVSLAAVLSDAYGAEPVPPRPSQLVYIYDYAGLVDEADEEKIREVAAAIDEKTGAQIVVVTVNDLAGRTIEDYALTLFRSWGIGDKEKNNGILILVNKENLLLGKSGRIRIEVGYGLEGAITDGRAGWILDNFALPAFEEGEFSRGITDTFMAVAAEVAQEYGLDLKQDELSELTGYVEEVSLPYDLIFAIIVFIFISMILLSGTGGRPRRRRPYGGFGPFWGPFNSGGFGGGFGGFGGGFGSGGGGSFGGGSSGGGGASR